MAQNICPHGDSLSAWTHAHGRLYNSMHTPHKHSSAMSASVRCAWSSSSRSDSGTAASLLGRFASRIKPRGSRAACVRRASSPIRRHITQPRWRTRSALYLTSLIDYEEEVSVPQPSAPAAGAAKPADGEKDKKGSYVGIHSTGFRDFLLKPELLRAISDLGFEHPSEGRSQLTSATGVHSAVDSRYGCTLPGQVWYG